MPYRTVYTPTSTTGCTLGLLSNSLKSNPHGVARCSLVSAGTCVGIVFVGAAFTKNAMVGGRAGTSVLPV